VFSETNRTFPPNSCTTLRQQTCRSEMFQVYGQRTSVTVARGAAFGRLGIAGSSAAK